MKEIYWLILGYMLERQGWVGTFSRNESAGGHFFFFFFGFPAAWVARLCSNQFWYSPSSLLALFTPLHSASIPLKQLLPQGGGPSLIYQWAQSSQAHAQQEGTRNSNSRHPWSTWFCCAGWTAQGIPQNAWLLKPGDLADLPNTL